ncbi:MAG: right-handed parallel beta-helix repeat-containing protein [Oligosphaeraceae bacterium]|nr:right-handed parallel beta-helix repeat-containing protein [Oligosphaeraceae bacterium]
MYKLLLLTLMVLACPSWATWTLRVQVSSAVRLKYEQPKDYDLKVRLREREKRSTFEVTKMVEDEWEECSFTIIPQQDGEAILLFSAAEAAELNPWVRFDNLQISGAEISNPDFEQLDEQGQPLSWTGTAENFRRGAGEAQSGAVCARVNGAQPLSRTIQLRQGQKVSLTFFALAEEVAVPGKSWDQNIVMDPHTGQSMPISSGRLSFVPTFENCSIYLNRLPEEQGKDVQNQLSFRRQGQDDWQEAFPLVDVWQENAWRGSLLQLQEDCQYEVQIKLTGEVDTVLRGEFRTQSSQVPVARTITLDPAVVAEGWTVTESGRPDGYVRYVCPEPIQARPGETPLITADGAEYVIFEGLTVRAQGRPGAINLNNSRFIQVRNCDLSGFGRIGVRRVDLDGKFYTAEGAAINYDPGIRIAGCRDILVERCYIHHPASTANSWLYSHPAGPNAILVGGGNQNTVVRYNDFIGNDRGRWNDAIECSGNGMMYGGFTRDADIYGNWFIFANDDCIEMEGGEMNLRFYYNRLEGYLSGASTGCCRLGPSYQFRNIYLRAGDENSNYGNAFKNGHGNQGYGSIFILNNTVALQAPGGTFSGFHGKPPRKSHLPRFKAFVRNNICTARGQVYNKGFVSWNADLGYDLLYLLKQENIEAEKLLLGDLAKTMIFAEPQYVDPEKGNFELRPGTSGYNAAQPLPNLTVKHIGAFQEDAVRSLPFRPIPWQSDRQEIYFSSVRSPLSQTFTVSADTTETMTFTVHCNDEFFQVEPASGTLGRTHSFTVTLQPGKMLLPRRFNGALVVRLQDGFSIPVSIYADYRDSEERQSAALQGELLVELSQSPDSNQLTGEVEIQQEGYYFAFFALAEMPVRRASLTIGETTAGKVSLGKYDPLKRWVANLGITLPKFHLPAGRHKILLNPAEPTAVKQMLLTREPEKFTH